MPTFLEIDEGRLSGAVVIVDVDGTITHDAHAEVDAAVVEKIRRVAKTAHVYLSSNGDLSRTRDLARQMGVGHIDTPHRKPSRRVLETLDHEGVRRIVIGDKALTDGLLAVNTGAEYMPVQRIRHSDDRMLVKFTYFLDDVAEYVITSVFPALPYIVLARPLQWIKNVLVFAPLFFASEIAQPGAFAKTALAAIVFSLTSSAMYVLNDIADREHDKVHRTKRGRPVASGAVSVPRAYAFLATLAALAAVGAYLLPGLAAPIAMYVCFNIAYSYWLKNVAFVDVVLVAFFYVLRVIAGGSATQIYVSPWIVSVVFFGALFLAVGKRRAEFVRGSARKVLKSYSLSVLSAMLVGSSLLTVLAYGMYTVFGSHAHYAVFSTLFVLFALHRVLAKMLTGHGDAEYPETLLFRDRWVIAAGIGWIAYMAAIFYVV